MKYEPDEVGPGSSGFIHHYEVTMSGALMANYYISWRLENNVMSSKYLVMRALHDH